MSTSVPQAQPPDLTVGGYALLTRLGEGGMGVVHLAQRPGEQRVALKVLRPHIIGDDEARQRLAREVGSLSRIRSPRIAEIVDADPYGPIPYVATRYVPGLSLREHVRQEGILEGADLVHLAAGLAEALAAVHACGVLHRDIKPSNVLLEGRNPVLIDFGLARVADDPRLTHTGWLLGTPGYLAPEILYGDDATTASDVHSWAACVAYAGTGRSPFGGGPGMAIMDRVRRGEHNLDGLPPRMEGLLSEALAAEPYHRPTLAELLRELRPGDRFPDPFPSPSPRDEESFTVPLAVAAQAGADSSTGVLGIFDDADGDLDEDHDLGPATQPVQQTRPSTQHVRQSWDAPVASTAPSFWIRARRTLTFLALTLLAAAGVAAYPYLAFAALALGAWLLRSGSLAGSAADARRMMRGRKWFDGPQTLVAAPWHLAQALPGTLGLLLWSGGLGLAGALLGYAAALPPLGIMGTSGLLFGLSLGFGPGGDRVRGPLRRAVHPLASNVGAWLVVTLAILAGAGLIASINPEPDWTPSQTGPFPDSVVDGVRGTLP